jgi:hypothetical protein
MPKFRKKPVVIEAVLFETPSTLGPDWFVDAFRAGRMWYQEGVLTIATLEGNHRANVGDWIIQGIKGELYPCKPDIFAATYEAVDE